MEYLDYNRTVVGYHGTTVAVARRIVLRETPFTASANPGDWLGRGIYFWKHAPKQAWAWARQEWLGQPVAVLGSMIRLGNCLDLLDPANVRFLVEMHAQAVALREATGEPPLKNVRTDKRLDCAVFEYAYAVAVERGGPPVDTSRAVYVRAGRDRAANPPRLWPTS